MKYFFLVIFLLSSTQSFGWHTCDNSNGGTVKGKVHAVYTGGTHYSFDNGKFSAILNDPTNASNQIGIQFTRFQDLNLSLVLSAFHAGSLITISCIKSGDQYISRYAIITHE